jgi:transposase
MARKRTMTEYREVVKMITQGQTIRAIQRLTGIHRKTIRILYRMAKERGWGEKCPDEETIRSVLYPGREAKKHALDAYGDAFNRWVSDGVSFTVMHQMLRENHRLDLSEPTVRRYVRERFPAKAAAVVRRDLVAGEAMEVDFGFIGLTIDDTQPGKKLRKTYVFSARLRYSRRAYRALVFSQDHKTFLRLHMEAFEFFGGVPKTVVPDNLKSAVIRAAFLDDPLIHKSYIALAEYYGFAIAPTLPYTPQHKGGVESDIKYIKGNFLPRFRERQRMRGQDLLYSEAKEELAKWTEATDERIVYGTGNTVKAMFCEEKKHLKELANFRWEILTYKEVSVHRDGLIQFDKSFYSVPYALIGRKVMVAANGEFVRIYRENKQVALHPRSKAAYRTITQSAHLCDGAIRYLETTAENLIRRSAVIGPCVKQVAEQLLSDKSQVRIRSVLGILNLAKKYTSADLEKAAARALLYRSGNYQYIKRILEKGLQNQNDGQILMFPAKYFARPATYWQTGDEP